MKKAGILTFQNANNYGAVFQAYALKKTIEKLGCKAWVIDYDSKAMGLKRIQKKQFADFIKENLNLTEEYDSGEKIDVSKFDAIITGSDQVWNPYLTKNDMTYFLDFAKKDVKKISYAASIGLNGDLFMQYKEVFQTYVPDFDGISLREETHVPYIQSLVPQKEVSALADPSLLLKKEEYLSLAGDEEENSEEYIFVFSYALDAKMYDFANMLSLKSGYKIRAISPYGGSHFVSGTKILTDVSPKEWLRLFQNAKLVITDSFHGMMFSVLFQKPFYAYTPNRSNVARVTDALKKLELEDRKLTFVKSVSDVSYSMDYERVNKILDIERKRATEYLKKQLFSE